MARPSTDPGALVPARILDESRGVRRLAVAGLIPDTVPAALALRSVMVRDEDAEIRARAAARLRASPIVRSAIPEGAAGEAILCARTAIADALADALLDPSPFVREEAARTAGALAKGPFALVMRALREAIRRDSAWRVRRAAVRAYARLAEASALDVLFGALDDPFWRVRYAAIQALAARPSAEAPSRDLSPREAAARAYLDAARRGERAIDVEPAEPRMVQPDDAASEGALGDADPAVVTARLLRAPPGPEGGAALVAALGSSHASLRRAAVRLLAARGDADELFGALAWLDDPRVLYAADAVHRLMRRVPTLALVERTFADPPSCAGALAWALVESARLHMGAPRPALAAASRHEDVRVRRAAIVVAAERGDVRALLDATQDAEESARAEAVDALTAALDDPAVRAALPPPEDGPFVARALLGAVRLWIGRARDPRTEEWLDAVIARAALAPWSDVKAEAIALRAHRGALTDEERASILADPDPWLREAAMSARAGADRLASDPDPFVRRTAARAAFSGGLDPSERHRAATIGARSADAWIRASAAGALDASSEDGFALLLRLTRDRSPMVRAAAADAIDRHGDVHARCLRVLGSDAAPEDVRLAAHARLVASPGPSGLAALVSDLRARDLSATDREALRATALAYPEAMRAQIAELESEIARAPRRAIRAAISGLRGDSARPQPIAPAPIPAPARSLGRTGISVAPLGISGAGEMPAACYEAARDAGANVFFWEPTHRALSSFLPRAERRHDLVIVTGSYEADARSIEADAERALRRLRIDTIGAMLLFWVRSPARLTEGAYEALARLQQQGKVRAIGLSTHDRALAEDAVRSRAWDVVMCRLSAAHPGAERSLLPAAVETSTGVIAFSALCYGRLVVTRGNLRGASPDAPVDLDAPPITAPDCYRYALSQPGVSVCLSAPRRFRELSENLAVLRDPLLDAATMERLRAHGERVREQNRAFTSLVHRA
ncbi:MAG: aldo/keto reductase [Polyangiaceae bacterium]